MSRSKHPEIRALLRANDDGMTIAQINAALDISQNSVRQALEAMPDVYIDRYLEPVRGQYPAVWCAVVPPPNCPHPTAGDA
tara:strand:- start:533 stop:775 length:243 start_codon:yes stop_codon:yes gene_type:complete